MKNEIKHPLERYKLIADPTIRQQCIENFEKFNQTTEYSKEFDDGSIADAISCGFYWNHTPEGRGYWEGIHDLAINGGLLLLHKPIEPTNEPNELDQLRSENEKLREWIISIVNRSPMTTTQIQVILSPYDIHQAKQLLNK